MSRELIIIRGRELLEVLNTFFWNFRGAGIIRGWTLLEVIRYTKLFIGMTLKILVWQFCLYFLCKVATLFQKWNSYSKVFFQRKFLNAKKSFWLKASQRSPYELIISMTPYFMRDNYLFTNNVYYELFESCDLTVYIVFMENRI